jgi:hypothetical protein
MDVGLIFGMIIAIIVITLVFVFGFQQLSNLTDVQNSAEMIKARQNLEVAVGRVYGQGGESTGSLKLSFPSTVRKVCFMPVYTINYAGKRSPYSKNDLINGLIDQDLAADDDAAKIIVGVRIHQNSTGDDVDEKMGLLVFFMESAAPTWYDVPHLAPSEKDGEFLCVSPKTTVWLQRRFDTEGAWVDVEEA